MGNWRTVNITGTIAADQVGPLRRHLTANYDDLNADAWTNFGPPTIVKSMAGLNDWTAEKVDARGNLAERDYTPEDVAGHLRALVSVAPSMALSVHCGGDYEDDRCVATVTVRDGVVEVQAPQVDAVSGPRESDMQARLLGFLS